MQSISSVLIGDAPGASARPACDPLASVEQGIVHLRRGRPRRQTGDVRYGETEDRRGGTGPKGLLETMKKGSIIAISSTCSPETVEKLDALARANVGVPLIGAVRELVKEGRKIEQTNPPDWTGTGTDLS